MQLQYSSVRALSALFFIIICISSSTSQEHIVPLWPEGIKDNPVVKTTETHDSSRDILWIEKVQEPTLEIFLPVKKNATGKAIIICPGGGYTGLAYDWEGTAIAKWANSLGIAAFVLKYRLPDADANALSTTVSLQDAQKAMRIVRHNAEEWNVSTDQIGIMGFSAGGHLASTLATHYDEQLVQNPTVMETLSARPDFAILVYPVITMQQPTTHYGSRENLIGKHPTQEMIDHYSNELHVDENTPPTFLVHSTDDKAVPVKNSLLFYEALEKAGVSTEMHIYPKGGHGYALSIGGGHEQTWVDRLAEWLNSLEF